MLEPVHAGQRPAFPGGTRLSAKSARSLILPVVLLLCMTTMGVDSWSWQERSGQGRAVVGAEALVPDSSRAHYSRFVNVRPGQGETVGLNPPRFSWFYCPHAQEKLKRQDTSSCNHVFTFQISPTADFKKRVVDVTTPYNFYNTLRPLEGAAEWYWRVGYDLQTASAQWSAVYRFTIAATAKRWDRSALSSPGFEKMGHPRILFNRTNIAEIRRLRETNPDSRDIFAKASEAGNAILQSSWWKSFPETDIKPAPEPYLKIAYDLTLVAFLRVITGDQRYEGVKERAVKLASFPRGGRSSPEGAGGESDEDSTQINEMLALIFDWLYQELDESERAVMIRSLEWRTDHVMNGFSWKYQNQVHQASLSTMAASHQYEAAMVTASTGLALFEHSKVGRDWYELSVNYLIGVSNSFGFDEEWNEGPGYGLSKLKWLLTASVYYDTALRANLGLNPYYREVGDFFSRIAPPGLPYSPWGNNSGLQSHLEINRSANYRTLAFMTGDGRFLKTWRDSGGEKSPARMFRPWIEYALPHLYSQPAEELETETVKLFPVGGWVTASTQPPGSRTSFGDAVGIIFQARPRGAYGHSFNSDGSFQIYAYGEQVNHGGGSTVNQDAFAYHTMSHNTILVDGLGQAQHRSSQPLPMFARILAFREGVDYVYFAGDLTNAYPRQPGDYKRWGFPIHPIYSQRDLSHLQRLIRHVIFVKGKYFVIYDDIEASKAATFTWLYHVLPDQPFQVDAPKMSVDYAVGKVKVRLAHLAQANSLVLEDFKGLEGMANRFTGEDYSTHVKPGPLPAHNLWISNKEPARQFKFLAVVFPYKEGDPIPSIESVASSTVRVTYGTQSDTITFSPDRARLADFSIDAAEINARSRP